MDEDFNSDNVVVPEATTDAPLQDNPILEELERIQNRGEGRSKREKLLYTKNRVEAQLKELDGEDGVIAPTVEDDKPMTVAMFKQLQRESQTDTAKQMADRLSDSHERELVKHYLDTRIVASGNPEEDYRLALAGVNALKNKQIIEESQRGGVASTHVASAGAPATREVPFEPTAEEASFMRAPFNLTKEAIIAARPK